MNQTMATRLIGAACLVPALAWSAIRPPSAPGPQTPGELLARLAAHGYASPSQAMQDLRHATPPGAADPLDLRWRWHDAVATIAIRLEDPVATRTAVGALKTLAQHDRCEPCATAVLLREEQRLETARDLPALRALLATLAARPLPADAQLRYETWAARASGHDLLGEYDVAVEAAVQAAEVAARHDMPAARVDAIAELANVNASRRDLERAIALSREGYKRATEIGYGFAALRLRTNEAYALATLKETTQRRVVLLDVLRLARAAPGLERYELTTLINLSAYSNDTHDYAHAIRYATDAERLAQGSSDPNDRAFALANRGAARAHSGHAEAGLAELREGIAIAEHTGVKLEIVDLLQLLVDTCDDLGRPQPALDALRRIVALDAELVNTQREEAVLRLQEKFSVEQKSREIERLQLQGERSAAELEAHVLQQRLWTAMAIAIGLAALLLAQWLGRSRQRSRRLQIDNARLSEQSLHDPLTGAFNRRFCELEMARREHAGEAGAAGATGLVIVDVDHFKHINDGYGHAAGDDVLVELAKRLRRLVRERDAVVRWGGEEFVLVLPDTPREALPALAARVLEAVGGAPVVLRDGRQVDMRACAGAVTWPVWPGQPWDEALALADEALYASKQRGRNRATCVVDVEPRLNGESLAPTLAEASGRGQLALREVLGPPWREAAGDGAALAGAAADPATA